MLRREHENECWRKITVRIKNFEILFQALKENYDSGSTRFSTAHET